MMQIKPSKNTIFLVHGLSTTVNHWSNNTRVVGCVNELPHRSGVEVFFIQKSNGKIDVPANPTVVVTVTKDNVQSALIDSGYYPASDFTGLK